MGTVKYQNGFDELPHKEFSKEKKLKSNLKKLLQLFYKLLIV